MARQDTSRTLVAVRIYRRGDSFNCERWFPEDWTSGLAHGDEKGGIVLIAAVHSCRESEQLLAVARALVSTFNAASSRSRFHERERNSAAVTVARGSREGSSSDTS